MSGVRIRARGGRGRRDACRPRQKRLPLESMASRWLDEDEWDGSKCLPASKR